MSDTLTPPPPIKIRWFFGIFATFLIFVVIAVYSSQMAQDTSAVSERATTRYDNLAKLRAEDEKTLTTADWVDQTKGTVRIPIDEALPQAINTLKSKPAAMGAEIPGSKPAAAPAPAPATAAATTNAAPATNSAPSAPAKSASPPKKK